MKIGLLAEGGGMKCAYGAGVFDAFLDYNINFDYAIGVSAGATNTVSFLAGQRDRNRRFYTDHISNPMYFGVKPFLKTGNAFNLEYIYKTLTNSDGGDALDFEALMASPTQYELVATCAETGKPEYFSKKDLIKDNYLHFMATCALPALCKPVKINGKHYYDGGVSDSIPVQRALDQGCNKIVVVSSKPRNFVKEPENHRPLYSLFCCKYPKIISDLNHRHKMFNDELKTMYELEKQGKCFIFTPEDIGSMSTYTMDAAANQRLYDSGITDFKNRYKEFEQFLTA